MNPIRASLLSALVLASTAFSSVRAGECTPRISDGWVSLPPVEMPMMAGFGRIENDCATAATIVGVRSGAFGDVSLHETTVVDGVSRMRALPRLDIAAGASATLQPGGLHLMLMQPVRPLAEGEAVPVEFLLEGGGVVSGSFEVRGPGG